jgi:hypothetical protein
MILAKGLEFADSDDLEPTSGYRMNISGGMRIESEEGSNHIEVVVSRDVELQKEDEAFQLYYSETQAKKNLMLFKSVDGNRSPRRTDLIDLMAVHIEARIPFDEASLAFEAGEIESLQGVIELRRSDSKYGPILDYVFGLELVKLSYDHSPEGCGGMQHDYVGSFRFFDPYGNELYVSYPSEGCRPQYIYNGNGIQPRPLN